MQHSSSSANTSEALKLSPKLTKVQALAQALVRIKSVTPNDNGCQKLIREKLEKAGFHCVTLQEKGTTNLLAIHGNTRPFAMFLGHTDVVPEGDHCQWDHDPYCGDIYELDGEPCLYGRGSADMKGGDAAMTEALLQFVQEHPEHKGSVGLLITSNEEGDAVGGVPFCVEYLKEHDLIPDYCLIPEPSSVKTFGDEIKNGRRGDVNVTITVHGIQGHVAVPESCDNAAHHAARLICALIDNPCDLGSEFFPPTSFQVSNCRCGTGADNVVPGTYTMRCNFRFNDLQSFESIKKHVCEIADNLHIKCDYDWSYEGPYFLTKGGKLLDIMKTCVTEVMGREPVFTTSGGTSDGRFIAPLGVETMEFGPITETIHRANEHVSLSSLQQLQEIYVKALTKLMA